MSTSMPSSASRAVPEPGLVLIVEDEKPIAETIAHVVQEAGYTPLVALHGRQGLELARSRRPALIVTDLMLPYLDGRALIAALRKDAAAHAEELPPIVLMTASGLAQGRAAGADVVLRKPFDLTELETLLHHYLGPPVAPTDPSASPQAD